MSELPEYVLELLSKIARDDHLSDYTIELSAGSKNGDNFLGLIHRAVLLGQRDGVPAELRLIIKLSTTNKARRKEMQMDALFKREVLMLNKILPLFEKFQRDRGLTKDEAFTSYPKCYAAIADEHKEQFVVIMEDLKAKAFDLLPKEIPIERDHLFMIVTQLARLHAISFAIKDQQPEVYNELRKVTDLYRDFFVSDGMKKYQKGMCDRAIAALDIEPHIEWLKDISENAHDQINAILGENAGDPFSVISHGDMWTTNILFHHDNDKVCVYTTVSLKN